MVIPPYNLAALAAPGDAALCQVVRRHFDGNLVARQNADKIHAQLAGDMGQNLMAVGGAAPERLHWDKLRLRCLQPR